MLALSDIYTVAENAGRLTCRLVIECASRRQDPSNLPFRTDDAELVVKGIAAMQRYVPLCINPLDIVGMDPVAKICVAFRTSRLESEDGFELWRPGKPAGWQVPIPDADAGAQLDQSKSLFAFTQGILCLV